MALAAVVSLVAATNDTTHDAYAIATNSVRQVQARRPTGQAMASTMVAMALRMHATCHDVRIDILMAAPPVENRMAATARVRRALTSRANRAADARASSGIRRRAP